MKNRQTKKVKTVKRKLKLKGVFFLSVLLFLFVYIIYNVLNQKVKSVEVEGNNYLTDGQIIKLAGLLEPTSILKTFTNSICKEIKTNEMVNECKIQHNLNFTILIKIDENIPLFYYLDQDRIALSNHEFIDVDNTFGVPSLINYVPEKILDSFISGLSSVDNDIIRSVSEIEYSPSKNSDGSFIDEERFMLKMNDGNTVYINNLHVDVLNYYKKIYASIGEKKGVYYLDCDFDNYYFKEYE